MKKIILSLGLLSVLGSSAFAGDFLDGIRNEVFEAHFKHPDLSYSDLMIGNQAGAVGLMKHEEMSIFSTIDIRPYADVSLTNKGIGGGIGVKEYVAQDDVLGAFAYQELSSIRGKVDSKTTTTGKGFDKNGEPADVDITTETSGFKRFSGGSVGIGFETRDYPVNIRTKIGKGLGELEFEKEISVFMPIDTIRHGYTINLEVKFNQKTVEVADETKNLNSVMGGLSVNFF